MEEESPLSRELDLWERSSSDISDESEIGATLRMYFYLQKVLLFETEFFHWWGLS